jgi:uncharacterized repeat protein (TIGR01451 family)
MSRSRAFLWWIPSIVLTLLLVSQGIAVGAAPVAVPLLGLTPTPTFTPTEIPTPTTTPGPTRKAPPGDPDPVIIKQVDPAEVTPGDEVTWTIWVTNEGQKAAIGVVVTDEVPEYLEILEVTTTQGTVTVEGQRVTVEVGVVGPGFDVEIVIRTLVRPDTPAPLTLENLAVLRCDNCNDQEARAILRIKGPLMPTTGGLSTWWMVAACLGTGLVGLSLVLSKRERG